MELEEEIDEIEDTPIQIPQTPRQEPKEPTQIPQTPTQEPKEPTQISPNLSVITYDINSLFDILGLKFGVISTQVFKKHYRNAQHNYAKDKIRIQTAIRAYYILSDPKLRDALYKYGKMTVNPTASSIYLHAEEGNLDAVKTLIKEDHSRLDKRKEKIFGTPLYFACRSNQLHVVDWLLQHGADPDLDQNNGCTALHVAAWYGHPSIVRYLLEHGANPNKTNRFKESMTPFQEASVIFNDQHSIEVRNVFVEITKDPNKNLWLKASANDPSLMKDLDLTKINALNPSGQTMLYIASKKGYYQLSEYLLKQGADMTLVDISNSTPLHAAAYGNHPELVKLFLEQGADPRLINIWGKTPEEETRSSEVKKIFRERRERQKFNEVKNDKSGIWLKQYYSDSWLTERDGKKRTLLHVAAREGNMKWLKFLVNKGADLDAIQDQGSTPLHTAAFRGQVDVVDYLIRKGANISYRNGEKRMPEDEVERAETFDSKPVPLETKNRIKDIFKEAKCLHVNSGYNEVFRMKIFDAESNMVIKKCHIHPETDFGTLARLLDPTIPELPENCREPKKLTSIPMRFSIAGRLIPVFYHTPVLQQCTKVMNSVSKFVDFPISLKCHRNDESKEMKREAWETPGDEQQKMNFKPERISIDGSPNFDYLNHVTKNGSSEFIFGPVTFNFPKNRPDDYTFRFSFLKSPVPGAVVFQFCDFINPDFLPNVRLNKIQPNPTMDFMEIRSPKSQKHHSKKIVEKSSFETPKSPKMEIPESAPRSEPLIIPKKPPPLPSFPIDKMMSKPLPILPQSEKFSDISPLSTPKSQLFLDIPEFSKSRRHSVFPNNSIRLYILDTYSGCWYGDPKSVTCKIPCNGTFALISKERIAPYFSLHRDYLSENYLEEVKEEGCYRWSGYRIILECPRLQNWKIAYHGTNIEAVESIIRDGVLIPGTVSSNGKVINPPHNHIARKRVVCGLADYSGAIFVSPSFGYASDRVYSKSFSWNGKTYKPVLECIVAPDAYTQYGSTTRTYKLKPFEDPNLEWRITDPLKMKVISVLLVECDGEVFV